MQSIDQDNLKLDESVGTFRWNNELSLINAPKWNPDMRQILLRLDKGWEGYIEPRFYETAVDDSINVQPHQLDGLSWPMTLVRLLKMTKMWTNKQVNIVVMGGSAKGEERIFCNTNYFEELTHFYPDCAFKLYFAGPELSEERHNT